MGAILYWHHGHSYAERHTATFLWRPARLRYAARCWDSVGYILQCTAVYPRVTLQPGHCHYWHSTLYLSCKGRVLSLTDPFSGHFRWAALPRTTLLTALSQILLRLQIFIYDIGSQKSMAKVYTRCYKLARRPHVLYLTP